MLPYMISLEQRPSQATIPDEAIGVRKYNPETTTVLRDGEPINLTACVDLATYKKLVPGSCLPKSFITLTYGDGIDQTYRRGKEKFEIIENPNLR